MPTTLVSEQFEDIERIHGDGRIRLFKRLIEDKTVLRVFLLGKNYERLTIVTDIIEENGSYFITVDYPAGFRLVVGEGEQWRLRFEFTGKDRLPYVFRTVGGEIIHKGLKLPLPNFIERRQRRKNFRLEAPLGTVIKFSRNGKKYEANVINVSTGGALISLPRRSSERPQLELNEYIKALNLVFPSDEERLIVHIKEALIKRVQKDLDRGHYLYALQFTDMEKEETNLLQELIFKFQREYLRKRQLLDD